MILRPLYNLKNTRLLSDRFLKSDNLLVIMNRQVFSRNKALLNSKVSFSTKSSPEILSMDNLFVALRVFVLVSCPILVQGLNWAEYKKKYDKQYSDPDEDFLRQEIFHRNKALVALHNSEYDHGVHSFSMAINNFSDWTEKELSLLSGYKRPENFTGSGSLFLPPFNVELPEHVDWREKGYVTPVKKSDKQYSDEDEDQKRELIFKKNQDIVEKHNSEFLQGTKSYSKGINKFSDRTQEELSKLLGYKPSSTNFENAIFLPPFHAHIPREIDWRKQGYVTPVKDQGDCGSCWAFSATGGLEGQHKRKTGKLVSLSEQNLVDCDHDDHGCDGGFMRHAFNFIKNNHGIDTEKSYPYEASEGECRFNTSHVGATDTGYIAIEQGNENKLKIAVATQGPITVAMDAHDLFSYDSGVYSDPDCDPSNLNHGVLAVGYGKRNGYLYWLVKNSWDADWGLDGYFMLARDEGNMCGVASDASYPSV